MNLNPKDIVLNFSPPYSPFLNPTEKLFTKWKNYVKSTNCMNEEQLLQIMELGFSTITHSDCDAWYRNMKKYIILSLEEVEILE